LSNFLLEIKKKSFYIYTSFYIYIFLLCHTLDLDGFSTIVVYKINELEMKFFVVYFILGKYVPGEGHLKIHYFMSSTFMQIGLPCMGTSKYQRWFQDHSFGEIFSPQSPPKQSIFSFI